MAGKSFDVVVTLASHYTFLATIEVSARRPDTHFSLAVRHDIRSCTNRFANRADWVYLTALSCDLRALWPRHPEASSLLQPKLVSTDGKWRRGESCSSGRKSRCLTMPFLHLHS